MPWFYLTPSSKASLNLASLCWQILKVLLFLKYVSPSFNIDTVLVKQLKLLQKLRSKIDREAKGPQNK